MNHHPPHATIFKANLRANLQDILTVTISFLPYHVVMLAKSSPNIHLASRYFHIQSRKMTSQPKPVYFGQFEVSSQVSYHMMKWEYSLGSHELFSGVEILSWRDSLPCSLCFTLANLPGGYLPIVSDNIQVFHATRHCFALVNLKPLLPGHVLVIPNRVVPRLTDLSSIEIGDIFVTVQKVQRMLAHVYFSPETSASASGTTKLPLGGKSEDGSFNIAVQDGPDAGQSVPHVHCHIIPRLKGNSEGDAIYGRLASEDGNVGGHLWDLQQRPVSGGKFPKIEDADRKARSAQDMQEEAAFFKAQMEALGLSPEI